ncbi:hypothetical protein [Bauldia litoralis]|uniref:hypothetical protein n=1 Tax=Bauldia litoralis TaxID=665467 RepID=UPI00326652F8
MKRLLLLTLLGTAATVAHAQNADNLPDLVAAFVAEERESATPERQAAISECILGAFEGLTEEELEAMIVPEDFEDSFDNLLEAYPEREEIVEVCEDL